MGVLARSQETLEQLENIRTNDDGGNIALDIGKIIGSTLSGISSRGSHIIKAVGSALHGGLKGLANLDQKVVTSFGKATGNITDSSGRAFEHVSRSAGGFVHDVLGGLSGSLLWGDLLLLTIFCLYQYVQNRRTFCHNETDTVASIDEIDDRELDITQHENCVDCGRVTPLPIHFSPVTPGNISLGRQAVLVLPSSMCLVLSLFCVMFVRSRDRRLPQRCI